MSEPCTHDITERETAAVADGLCPLCLRQRLGRVREALDDCLDTMRCHAPDLYEAMDDARATLATPPTPLHPERTRAVMLSAGWKATNQHVTRLLAVCDDLIRLSRERVLDDVDTEPLAIAVADTRRVMGDPGHAR